LVNKEIVKIESELSEIEKEIDSELLKNSKNFLDGIIFEVEAMQGEEDKSKQIVSNKIKAMEVASTLTTEIFDRELEKIQNKETVGEILSNIVDEVIEKSSVSSQLGLVEKRITEIENQIAKSQRILNETKLKVDSDTILNPSSSPGMVSQLIDQFESPGDRDDNSLRRASCCPIRFPRSSNFTRVRKMFLGRQSSRQQ
jgi:hypothetical protein